MAEEHSDQPSAGTDEPDEGAAGGLEPTGGPRRVVSEQSVDDILASLEETTESNEPTTQATTVRSETTELPDSGLPSASGFDGDDAQRTRDDAGNGDHPDHDVAGHDDTDNGGDTDNGDDADHDGVATDEPGGERTVETSDRTSRTESRDSALEAESLSESDARLTSDTDERPASDGEQRPSADDLGASLEHDDITGADVRAAEAGDGREPTPDVGDLDLSMDDLERTAAELDGESVPEEPSGAASDGSVAPDDAGPLAGAIDTDAPAPTESDDSTDSTGVLGRLKRLFSR